MLDCIILYYTVLQCMRRCCMVHNNLFGKNLLWKAQCFNGRGNGFATQHCAVASVIPIYCSVNDFGSMTPLLRFLSVSHASSGPVELKDIRITVGFPNSRFWEFLLLLGRSCDCRPFIAKIMTVVLIDYDIR